jgi:hypothetical protein
MPSMPPCGWGGAVLRILGTSKQPPDGQLGFARRSPDFWQDANNLILQPLV